MRLIATPEESYLWSFDYWIWVFGWRHPMEGCEGSLKCLFLVHKK
jgi:hypothetical protein